MSTKYKPLEIPTSTKWLLLRLYFVLEFLNYHFIQLNITKLLTDMFSYKYGLLELFLSYLQTWCFVVQMIVPEEHLSSYLQVEQTVSKGLTFLVIPQPGT